MSSPFRREPIGDGVFFSWITDPKFKHNRITASLLLPLEREQVTNRAVVPFILRKGCADYPDFTELNRKLCALYGASLACDVSKFGAYQALELSVYSVDDRFTLDNAHLVEESARLLAQVLLRPKLVDGCFSEQDVLLERQQLIDAIESQINDKRLYAMSKCKAAMCAGEKIAVEKYGYIEDAQEITPQSAYDAYCNALDRAQIEIAFVGAGEAGIAKEIFQNVFAGVQRHPVLTAPYHGRTAAEKVQETVEELDVTQSKLVMGFRTGEIKDRHAMMAMRMMVALFGGTPNSRLFLYVREKMSLCYYCASRFDRLTGLMFVDSGVKRENKQKAYDEILHQLDLLRRGEFEESEITATKLLLQTSLKAVGDSLGALDEWYLSQTVGGSCISPEEESALLEEITKDDIIKAAKQVTLDTVYFLTGKEAQ